MSSQEQDFILSNQVRCTPCGDTPYSAHRHDYKSCQCGAVHVDGGQDYLRRVGNYEEYEEMSITISDKELLKPIITEVGRAINTGRNPYGVVLAAFSGIRDANIALEHANNYWYEVED